MGYKKIIKEYIKEVKQALHCPLTIKLSFIKDLKRQLKDYYSDAEVTKEQLYLEFGSPEDIAAGFAGHNNIDKYKQQAKVYKILFILASVLAAVVAIFATVCLSILIYSSCNDSVTTVTNEFGNTIIYSSICQRIFLR